MGYRLDAAREYRRKIDAAGAMLTDAQASSVTAIYPQLKYDGALIAGGTRINWKGKLKRAAADVWDREENDPDNAPALWEDILYREGHRIIPYVISVGLAFSCGETGWWGDTLYRSVLTAPNTYTPEQYPAGWEVYDG